MKIIHCPLNGPRNAQEFICGGELRTLPQDDAGREAWADYVFLENNPAGMVREWWCHTPSGYWFIAERNTVTDEILRTWPAGELPESNAK